MNLSVINSVHLHHYNQQLKNPIMKNSILILFTSVLLISCEKPQNNSNACSDCCTTSIVNRTNFEGTPSDDFDISDAIINGDCLEITVRVGGGCGDLNFDLLAVNEVMESLPTQRNIRVILDDQDFCKAMLQKTISFDLSSLRTDKKGADILHLEGYSKSLVYNY